MNNYLRFVVSGIMALTMAACGKEQMPMQTNESPDASAALVPPARDSARVFISGHSLVDQPLPDFLTQIAQSLNTPMQWNRHYVVGSSIERRARGQGNENTQTWGGYQRGYNRDSEAMDVIAELRQPQTIQGPNYEVLVITEQHLMLEALINNNTVKYLRHYHDRFIDGNPSGVTFFYHSWISIDDKNNPSRWIAYERAASPIWQCMGTRVNTSLQAEGRHDRIVSLPAGAALAELIEKATQGNGLEGITAATVFETVDSIIGDEVHLHPLGAYYMALVTYASVFQRSPIGAWKPEVVSELQARVLQEVAADFVSRYYADYQPLTVSECQASLTKGGLGYFWGYVRDKYWRNDVGVLHAQVRYARRVFEWRRALTRTDHRNPFYFDEATDAEYWFAEK